MEHSGRYIDFANKLVQSNLGVCIIDHRGNGHSDGKEGDIDDFFDFIEDLYILIKQLKRHNKPIITYGHSMGGLITFICGLKYPEALSGQIFSSPALGVPLGCKNLPAAFYEGIASVAGTMKIPRTGAVLSTRNEIYVKAFRQDQMSNDFSTVKFMDQFLRIGVEYAANHAKEYAVPSLFLLGDKDLVIPIARNRALLKTIPYEQKQVIEYPGCMHDLLHDLDEEVEKILHDILGWIDNHIKNLNNLQG